MTEVLFEVAGIEVVDIKSEEDTEYVEGNCPTCGGDYYYSKSLILIDENQCETEVVILKDELNNDIEEVPLTLLTKLLSNKTEKETIKFMNITEFEKYIYNTLYIYDQLTNEGDYSLNFRSFDSYYKWVESEYYNSYIHYREKNCDNDNFYYEYPKVLKKEYLQAAKDYYEFGE